MQNPSLLVEAQLLYLPQMSILCRALWCHVGRFQEGVCLWLFEPDTGTHECRRNQRCDYAVTFTIKPGHSDTTDQSGPHFTDILSEVRRTPLCLLWSTQLFACVFYPGPMESAVPLALPNPSATPRRVACGRFAFNWNLSIFVFPEGYGKCAGRC